MNLVPPWSFFAGAASLALSACSGGRDSRHHAALDTGHAHPQQKTRILTRGVNGYAGRARNAGIAPASGGSRAFRGGVSARCHCAGQAAKTEFTRTLEDLPCHRGLG